jgi:hypothetical protein
MKGFLRAGHTPTLVASLLYFDVSFMAWVLLGPLAPFLRAELGLSATEQGLVTAFLYWVDRRTGLLGPVLTLSAGLARLHAIALRWGPPSRMALRWARS